MKITGNYTNQERRNFPLDAEGLAAIQSNIAATELIGRLAGDKAIISGCENNGSGTYRNPGWVFLCTRLHPEGELMYWEGGITTAGMFIKNKAIEVQAEGYSYPQAYTERTLAPGADPVDGEEYWWTDFHPAESTDTLRRLIDAQTAAIAKIKSVPPGVIEIFAGVVIPDNYLMCEGQAVSKTDYPELYSAIGDTYNTAPLWTGVAASDPAAGYFRVPDLRSRFIVGRNDGDSDYNSNGRAGGEKIVRLTAEQMPEHTHPMNDYGMVFGNSSYQTEYDLTIDGENVHTGMKNVSNTMQGVQGNGTKNSITCIQHNTKSIGGNQSHENRPPYYTLSYIIKSK